MTFELNTIHEFMQQNIFLFCAIVYGLVLLKIATHFHTQFSSQRRINILQQRQIRELTRDMRILLECGTGLGKRLDTQQELVDAVIHRQDKLDIEKPGDANYKQAMALMETGISSDDMQNACELSQGEINIIAQLKKASQLRQPSNHA